MATRPALTLAEVMSQEQLEQLILLAVHHDNSQGPSMWGGPWASHAITCLLQDILEGKRLGHLDDIRNRSMTVNLGKSEIICFAVFWCACDLGEISV